MASQFVKVDGSCKICAEFDAACASASWKKKRKKKGVRSTEKGGVLEHLIQIERMKSTWMKSGRSARLWEGSLLVRLFWTAQGGNEVGSFHEVCRMLDLKYPLQRLTSCQ